MATGIEIGIGRLVDRIVRGGMGAKEDVEKWEALQLVITVLSGGGRLNGNAMDVGMEGLAINAGIAAGALGGVLKRGGCGVLGRVEGTEWKPWEGEGGRCVVGVGDGNGIVGLAMDGEVMAENETGSIMSNTLELAKEMREGIAQFGEKVTELREKEGRGDFPRVYPSRKRVEIKKANCDAESRSEGNVRSIVEIAEDLVKECFKECGKFPGKSYRASCMTRTAERYYNHVNDMYVDDPSQIPSDEMLGNILQKAWKETFKREVRHSKVRLDGRGLQEIRSLRCQEAILPGAVHGSALFERGDTQVLATSTIGLPYQSQRFDAYIQEGWKRFMVHYGFPPYATGDTGFLKAPNRRETGHSDLVERALRHAIPDEYPYALRVTCETLASDGSSSMAAVSATSVALIDAGVPLKYPVVGVAMGAVVSDPAEDGNHTENVYLTDLLGAEDHFGDMDMKVCGTRDGVTALQMDSKRPEGLDLDVVTEALVHAKDARCTIMDTVEQELSARGREIPGCTDNVFTSIDGDGHEAGEEVCKPEIRTISVTRETVKALLSDRGSLLKDLSTRSNARLMLLPQSRPTSLRIETGRAQNMKLVMETLGKIELRRTPVANPKVGDKGEGLILKFFDENTAVVRMRGARGIMAIKKNMVKIGEKVRVEIVDKLAGGTEHFKFEKVAAIKLEVANDQSEDSKKVARASSA